MRVTRESRPAAPAAHEPPGRSGRVGRRGLSRARGGRRRRCRGGRDRACDPRLAAAARPGGGGDDRLGRRRRRDRGSPGQACDLGGRVPADPAVDRRDRDDERATPTGRGEGFGTGVIVNANGTIMTAFHVIEGAARIRVTFTDGTRGRAEVAQADPDNDTAVLVPKRLPEVVVPAVLGGGVQVGDETYAVGHPLGFVDSITAGVISGLDRSVKKTRQDPARSHPVRRGGQPRQLRRAAAEPRRAGDRDRHRARQPRPQRRLHRHRLRGADRRRGRW